MLNCVYTCGSNPFGSQPWQHFGLPLVCKVTCLIIYLLTYFSESLMSHNFSFHFPSDNWCWTSFCVLIFYLSTFKMNCLFIAFVHFLTQLSIFSLLSFIYILSTKCTCVTCIFFLPVCNCFVLLFRKEKRQGLIAQADLNLSG